MQEYEQMEKHELEQKLKKLQDDLEDIQEERKFVLGQTGIHLPGATVQKFEAEISELEKKIAAVKSVLKKK